jgi:predicted TIM-barrel fold metal-dependent hydrolase
VVETLENDAVLRRIRGVNWLASVPLLLLAACSTATMPRPTAPAVDYHQHLVSAAFAPLAKLPQRDGAALLRELDAAGIRRAVVLSVAYTYGDERKALTDPDRLTREENDWTSGQVSRSGGRLIGFGSANPLRPAALAEIERALSLPGMVGIKLHFGNAGISLRNPQHLARMREVFELAARRKVPILAHLRARGGNNYGAEDARLFLEHLVSAAPECEIIVAHLGTSGPGYGAQTDEVISAFAEAAERGDPCLRNLYFDVATNVTADTVAEEGALIAKRIRQLGPRRVLYGSDLLPPGGSIAAGWEIFRTRVPLTPAEVETIATNRTRFVAQTR